MTPELCFEDWWGKNYRSLTQTLNFQGIALSAWNAARREAREEDAKIADRHIKPDNSNYGLGYQVASRTIAAAIRARASEDGQK